MKQLSSIERAIRDVPSFAARYKDFIKRLENQGASESTINNYGYNLALICLEYKCLPEEISEDGYTDYYNRLLKRKASGSHMLHAVYCVRKYFKLYGLPCPITANPTIPARRTLPVVLSKDEVYVLLPACGDITDKTLISLMVDTGMRKCEVLALELRDLDFGMSRILIRQSKCRKDRYVPFSGVMQKVMKVYLRQVRPKRFVFEKEEGEPRSPQWPSAVLAKALGKTGILKHVTCHVLRHTYATLQLELGVDIRRIQLWLGHKRLDTTAVYLNIVEVQSDLHWEGPLDKLYPAK